MSKKCKWKKKSNSFSNEGEDKRRRRRWLLKDFLIQFSSFAPNRLGLFFLLWFHSLVSSRSNGRLNNFINTLRLKEEKKLRLAFRCGEMMEERLGDWNELKSIFVCQFSHFTVVSLLPTISHFSALRFTSLVLRLKMINNFYLLQQCFSGSFSFSLINFTSL